jgi:hypothetical protein
VPLSDDAILSELLFFYYAISLFFSLYYTKLLSYNIFLTLQDFLYEDDLLILLHIHLTSINPLIYLVPSIPLELVTLAATFELPPQCSGSAVFRLLYLLLLCCAFPFSYQVCYSMYWVFN